MGVQDVSGVRVTPGNGSTRREWCEMLALGSRTTRCVSLGSDVTGSTRRELLGVSLESNVSGSTRHKLC